MLKRLLLVMGAKRMGQCVCVGGGDWGQSAQRILSYNPAMGDGRECPVRGEALKPLYVLGREGKGNTEASVSGHELFPGGARRSSPGLLQCRKAAHA